MTTAVKRYVLSLVSPAPTVETRTSRLVGRQVRIHCATERITYHNLPYTVVGGCVTTCPSCGAGRSIWRPIFTFIVPLILLTINAILQFSCYTMTSQSSTWSAVNLSKRQCDAFIPSLPYAWNKIGFFFLRCDITLYFHLSAFVGEIQRDITLEAKGRHVVYDLTICL